LLQPWPSRTGKASCVCLSVTCPIALYASISEHKKIPFNQLNRATGHRIIDVVPTILEVAGILAPDDRRRRIRSIQLPVKFGGLDNGIAEQAGAPTTVNGIAQKPIEPIECVSTASPSTTMRRACVRIVHSA
jgi:hypothetical protein